MFTLCIFYLMDWTRGDKTKQRWERDNWDMQVYSKTTTRDMPSRFTKLSQPMESVVKSAQGVLANEF